MAITPPVFGSMTTVLPFWALGAAWQPEHGRSLAMARPDWRACSAWACTSMSRLRTMSSPGIGSCSLTTRMGRFSASTSIDRDPGRPRRSSS
jgi:hypothetical protein